MKPSNSLEVAEVHPDEERLADQIGLRHKSPEAVSYTHLDVYKRQGQIKRIVIHFNTVAA